MDPDPIPSIVAVIALFAFAATMLVEFAFISVNRSQLREAEELGDARAKQALQILSTPSRLLQTSYLVQTLSALLFVSSLIIQIPPDRGFYLTFGIIVVCWLLLAALRTAARLIATREPLKITLSSVSLVGYALLVSWPFAILLNRIGDWGSEEELTVEPVNLFAHEDGLRLLLDIGSQAEEVADREKRMITNILEMSETTLREVMVPRIDVVALDSQSTLDEALDVIIDAGHSRIPVYEENIDHIIGVLYAKDLLTCFRDKQPERSLTQLVRETHFVPISKKVNELFDELQHDRVHIALVVDEYGGTAGVVTIEDLLEEIVGEIQDEYDPAAKLLVQKIGAQNYLLNSRLPIDELAELLDVELDYEGIDTLGGMMFTLFGHVPAQGEVTHAHGWQYTIIKVDGRQIEQVRAERITPTVEELSAFQESEAENAETSQPKSMLNLSTSE